MDQGPLTEALSAVLAHHEEEMEKQRKIIADRGTEIALLVQELAKAREQLVLREIEIEGFQHITPRLFGNRATSKVKKGGSRDE